MSKIYTKENILKKFNFLYRKYSSYTQDEIRYAFNGLTAKEQKLLFMSDLDVKDKIDRDLVYKKLDLQLLINRKDDKIQELVKEHIKAKITKYVAPKGIYEDYEREGVLIYKDSPSDVKKGNDIIKSNPDEERNKEEQAENLKLNEGCNSKKKKGKRKKNKINQSITEKINILKLSDEKKEEITKNLYDKYITLDSEELNNIKKLVDENIDKYYYEYKTSGKDEFSRKLYVSSKLNILIDLYISRRYKQLNDKLEKDLTANEKEKIENKLLTIEMLFIENNKTTYNLLNKLSNKISENDFEKQLEDAMCDYTGEEKFSIYLVKRIKHGKNL